MTDTPMKPKVKPNLGAQKLTPEEQRRRVIDAAKASGARGYGAEFDAILRRVAKPKDQSAA